MERRSCPKLSTVRGSPRGIYAEHQRRPPQLVSQWLESEYAQLTAAAFDTDSAREDEGTATDLDTNFTKKDEWNPTRSERVRAASSIGIFFLVVL